VSAQYDGDYYSGQHVIVGNEPTISYKTSSSYSYDSEDWGNVYVEYSPMKLSTNKSGYDDLNFKGFTIGFSYAYMLGDSPVFLESGVETSGFYFSENYYDKSDRVKHSYEFYWAKIPVNIGLRYNVSEDFALVPYGGVNLTVNISAEERYKYGNGVKESYNLFDEDYMGDDGYKRFRIGWQGGLKFIVFNTVSIGASYKSDLTPFYSDFGIKQKFGGFSFGIGYCF
jgi:hypothetical protein